jgi:hypothetical protein
LTAKNHGEIGLSMSLHLELTSFARRLKGNFGVNLSLTFEMLYNIVGSIYLIEGLWEEAKACHFKIWETGFQGRFCPSMLDIIILLLLLFFLLIRVY